MKLKLFFTHSLRSFYESLALLLILSIFIFECDSLASQDLNIQKIDTLNIGVSNLVYTVDNKLAVRHFKVGDLAHGGIVFWVDESGEHGLVAALSDQNANIIWSQNVTVTGATGGETSEHEIGGIGAGSMNSRLIVMDNHTGLSAAKICTDLVLEGYSDWYLPSLGELYLMVINLHRNGCPLDGSDCPTALGDFNSELYWSSTERSETSAYRMDFEGGLAGSIQSGKKDTAIDPIRAIRRF